MDPSWAHRAYDGSQGLSTLQCSTRTSFSWKCGLCMVIILVGAISLNPFSNIKKRSERRVFALFHFVCILFLYLYCVSIDFCATERILFCLNPPPPPKAISKIPIFQNSNFPKFQFSKKTKETKKTKKNQLCQDFASPPLPPMVCAELFFLFFLVSLVFLENWNFGKLEFWIF